MINDKFIFCPICGKKTISYINSKKWFCKNCNFDLYNNVAAAVGVIIFDYNGNILLETRAKEPKKGYLALPGGFCDYNESAETAAIRECKEEIGIEPKKIEYLCSYPNDYEYKKIAYKTCDLFFTAELQEKKTIEILLEELHKQDTEVLSLNAYKIDSQEDIDKLPLAFDSAKKSLTVWLSRRKI